MTKKRDPSPTDQLPPSVPLGPAVLQLLDVAYRARRPMLLEGPTGIGKSEIVAEFCGERGMDHRVLDLSLLEPPDLVGLPRFEDGRTRYAVPEELPTGGRGVLMLEELNRAELPVMQPALHLLSARRLHGYELPAGWLCVAAINPEGEEYQVQRLDPALRSRFMQVTVHADHRTWLAWARRRDLHPLVLDWVAQNEDVFATSSPRSWTYFAEVLGGLDVVELIDGQLVTTLAHGYLPPAWAGSVTKMLADRPALPRVDAARFFGPEGEAFMQELVGALREDGRSDAMTAVAWQVRRILREAGALPPRAELERRLAPLPGDLREQCLRVVEG